MTKLIAEINETESNYTIEITKPKVETNKTDKIPSEPDQENKTTGTKSLLNNENRDITTEPKLTKKIINGYYVNKCEKLDKKYKFLEKYNLSKLAQEEIEN